MIRDTDESHSLVNEEIMRTLYLQRGLSLEGRDAFAGRKLFDEFSSISEESLVSFAVLDIDDVKTLSREVKNDFLSNNQLSRFGPDVIYFEGGLFYKYGEAWRWRVPKPILEEFVFEGGIAVIADIDRKYISRRKGSIYGGRRISGNHSDLSRVI